MSPDPLIVDPPLPVVRRLGQLLVINLRRLPKTILKS